jgi:wyosine [tRNA(Phe)-imidazoG37] synthetase (radical SAM superfamily)
MADSPVAPSSHVFGPVPSRRLGRSLGVDLVPYKTCTYDCVYCQLGQTTDKTLTRREYVPSGEVLRELESALQAGPSPDYVTLSGSGEPTLFTPLGGLIRGIKGLTDVPVAVLTNGSLLWLPEVRRAAAEADVVAPSLDAGDAAHFELVNRPHPGISFADMVAGLIQFNCEFRGQLWLEVFLLSGLTAGAEHVREIAATVAQIKPDRVHLNTIVRPPAEPWVQAASPEELAAAAEILGKRCEVVTDYVPEAVGEAAAVAEEAVLGLLRRRPCRPKDLAVGLGLHRNEVVKYLEHLLRSGAICTETVGAQTYYKVVRPPQDAGD